MTLKTHFLSQSWALLVTSIATFSITGFTLVQSIFLAKFLGPAERGDYAAILTTAALFSALGANGIQAHVARENALRFSARGSSHDSAACAKAYGEALMIGLISSVAAITGVCLVCAYSFPESKSSLRPYAVLAALIIPSEHIRNTLGSVDLALNKIQRFNRVRIITAAIGPIVVMASLFCGFTNCAELFVVSLASIPLRLGVLFLAYPGVGLRGASLRGGLRALRTAGGQIMSSVVGDASIQADTTMMTWVGSSREQGLYAAATPASSTLNTIASSSASLVSRMVGSTSGSENQHRQFRLILSWVVTVNLCVVTVLLLWGKYLIARLFGEAFSESYSFLVLLIPGAFANAINLTVEARLRALGVPMTIVQLRAISLLLMVATVIGGYDSFGASSVPIAWALAQLVYLGLAAQRLGLVRKN